MIQEFENFAFGWEHCLESNLQLQCLTRQLFAAGKCINIIPASFNHKDYQKLLSKMNIGYHAIWEVKLSLPLRIKDVAVSKLKAMKTLGCEILFDSMQEVIDIIRSKGLEGLKVNNNEAFIWPADHRIERKNITFSRIHFQILNVTGKIINIGCGDDCVKLKENYGAINVDIRDICPTNGAKSAADVIADARDLPFRNQEFDTAVLGDILEHMNDADAIQSLKEASRVAKRVVATIPEDYRPIKDQAFLAPGHESAMYTDGICAWHPRPITKEIIEYWLKSANLKTIEWERLDDGIPPSWGLVAEKIRK